MPKHSDVLKSSVLVSALSVVLTGVSFVNQVVIAREFGAGASLDSYLIAVSTPMLMITVIAAAVSFSLVPKLVASRRKGDSDVVAAGMLLSMSAMSAVVTSALWWASPYFMRIFAGAAVANSGDVVAMNRLAWLAFMLSVPGSVLTAVHHSAKRFVIPLLTGALPYVGMIVLVLAFAGAAGVRSLVWGMVLGYALAAVILYLSAARDLSIPAARPFAIDSLRGLPAAGLSTLCFTIFTAADAFWGSRLGAGVVSQLAYNQRMLVALGNVVIMGPSIVLLPHLSEAAAAGDDQRFEFLTVRALKAIVIGATLAALLVGAFARPVVALLFQRGRFDQQTTAAVSAITPIMMIGMVAMVSVVIMFRVFYSRSSLIAPAVLSVSGAAAYFILAGVFGFAGGTRGIATAYALTWWSVFALALWRLHRNGWLRPDWQFGGFGIRFGVWALASACLLLPLSRMMPVPAHTEFEDAMSLAGWILLAVAAVLTIGVVAAGRTNVRQAMAHFRTRQREKSIQ